MNPCRLGGRPTEQRASKGNLQLLWTQVASDSNAGSSSPEDSLGARPPKQRAGLAGFIHYSEHLWQKGLGSHLRGLGREPRPGLAPSHLPWLLCDPDLPYGPLVGSFPSLLPSWLGPACKSPDTWEFKAEF